MDPNEITRIETRYGFTLPREYRELVRRGFLHLDGRAYYAECTTAGRGYLWLNDMEWYTPRQIAEFEFEDYHQPGFVPFAFTAGGDLWCWHPRFTDERGTRVVLCPHDREVGTVYAANFGAALYRQVLEYCAHGVESEEELPVARAMLRRWAVDLACILPEAWCGRIEEFSRLESTFAVGPGGTWLGFISEATLKQVEREDLRCPEMDSEFQWMRPLTGRERRDRRR